MWLVRYDEKNSEGELTGRTAELQGDEFAPLGWSDLVDRRLSVPADISLRFISGTVEQSSIDEIPVGARVSMNATIQPRMTTLHLALLPGGWLPAGLAIRDGGLIFPDRCTLTELKGRFKPGRPAKLAADFIDLFDRREARMNPLLIALEGNTRSLPTRDQIQDQLNEVTTNFRNLMPSWQALGDDPAVVDAMANLGLELQETVQKTIEFLMRIASLLRNDVPRGRLESVLTQIASAARDCALPLISLPVLVAFSAAARTGRINPARKALKFTVQPYTRKDAYNAASDLRSLQVFGMALATRPEERPMLVTGDKDLALIWLGTQMGNFQINGNRLTFDVDPTSAFFPEEAMEVWRRLIAPELSADAPRC